ncbi:MAG: 4-hydroxy-3-methylbut-2-enyl diphosphate reductase [SAR202 cluster bacterium]|nr:4-hydroxy-3-methylbut-2-enyl diphosphate reductase [SAR202 cluster bacterium]|tara:strand:+ start:294 stop:1211 length:918 start_codon:yes stop_codon:yes gene_type:complete
MKVFLGVPRGFCAGVVRAIDLVELALKKYGTPVYVKHQIVHNPHVVLDLEKKGAITVEEVEQIPRGSRVVFSAHGSPPSDFKKAKERDLKVVDATCPLVIKVHNEAKKYSKEGRKLVLVGHRGHQEVKGTMGQSEMELVDDREKLPGFHWDKDTPVAVLTQTTLSVDDTQRSIETIKDSFNDVLVRNDLCYATTNRQNAVKEISDHVDLFLVIGARNSSNCNRLRDVAESRGVNAYLINGIDELNPDWLQGVENVGITSGASTPDTLVQAIIELLMPEEVIPMGGEEENITFTLPLEFREFAKDK